MNDSPKRPSESGASATDRSEFEVSEFEVEELLWRRLDGELSAEEEALLEARLAVNAGDRALQEQIDVLSRLLTEVEEIEAPEGLAERVEWLLRRKPSVEAGSSSRASETAPPESVRHADAGGHGRWFVPLAAATLLGAIGLVASIGRSPSGPMEDRVSGTAVVDRQRPTVPTLLGSFAVGDGMLEITSAPRTLGVELDWTAGTGPATVEVEGSGVAPGAGQPGVEIVDRESVCLQLRVAPGEEAQLTVDLSRSTGEVAVRVITGGQAAFERILFRNEINPGGE